MLAEVFKDLDIHHDGVQITKRLDEDYIWIKGHLEEPYRMAIGNVQFFTTAIINSEFNVIFSTIFKDRNMANTIVFFIKNSDVRFENLSGSYIYHDNHGIYFNLSGTCYYYDKRIDGPSKSKPLFKDSVKQWVYKDYTLKCSDGKEIFKMNQVYQIIVNRISDDIYIHYRQLASFFNTVNLEGESVEIVAQTLDEKHNLLGTSYYLEKSVHVGGRSMGFWHDDYYYLRSFFAYPIESQKVFAYPSQDNMKYLSKSNKKLIVFILWLINQSNGYSEIKSYIPKALVISKILPGVLTDL